MSLLPDWIDSLSECDGEIGGGGGSGGCGLEHGCVTVIPKILPGGNDSSDTPFSFDAKRKAIASSTACCRFKATLKSPRHKKIIIHYLSQLKC